MVKGYSSPPDLHLYNLTVWEIVRQIPEGKVCTYGQIADLIPPPEGMDAREYRAFGARWVGGAMARCPDNVPWQRVINAQGKISVREGSERQRDLLEEEGVEFDAKQRIDLKLYRWEGPSAEWLKEHGLQSEDQDSDSQQLSLKI